MRRTRGEHLAGGCPSCSGASRVEVNPYADEFSGYSLVLDSSSYFATINRQSSSCSGESLKLIWSKGGCWPNIKIVRYTSLPCDIARTKQ